MRLFDLLFGHWQAKDTPALLAAIDRAVNQVEPLLKQNGRYRKIYRKPVISALEYANSLAASVPGPVAINRQTFASDAFVHALFPSVDVVKDSFCASKAVGNYYREFPETNEIYALMGMRRVEKNIIGAELVNETIQRDVVQKIIYFNNHTIENLAPTEKQARELIAMSFFDSLLAKVKTRVDERKQVMQVLMQEKDIVDARLRTANAQQRPALKKALSKLITEMQSTAVTMDLRNYIDDFEAILLHPQQHLRLNQIPMFLDSMGIKRESFDSSRDKEVIFTELFGYDRRNWTVTMVHCSSFKSETFKNTLEKAYRKLSIWGTRQ